MILPKFGRTKFTKGVSLLAVFALTAIGFSSFSSENNADIEFMLAKSDLELDGLSDPLFEEIFQDKYHRALEAYNDSKGIFSCGDICQSNRRNLAIIDRELNEVQRQRLAARKAILQRAAAERLAAHQERMRYSHITSEERSEARRLARRAALGLGPPLTLEEKQARGAEAKAARIAARESRKTPEEAAAEADARQAARWYEYLDFVAQAHGFSDWANVEMFMDKTPEEREAIREANQSEALLAQRHTVRAAARFAQRQTPPPTTSPTPNPTTSPTPAPTESPTPAPTPAPTPNPTKNPTPAPTSNPTPAPTPEPTQCPVFQDLNCGGTATSFSAAVHLCRRKNCNQYCAHHGMTCVAAYHDDLGTCRRKGGTGCNQSAFMNICECAQV